MEETKCPKCGSSAISASKIIKLPVGSAKTYKRAKCLHCGAEFDLEE